MTFLAILQPFLGPKSHDVHECEHALCEAASTRGMRESTQVNNIKKYLNFIGRCFELFLHSELLFPKSTRA